MKTAETPGRRAGGGWNGEPWTLRTWPRPPSRPSRRPSAALRAASRLETVAPRWWLALQAAFSLALCASGATLERLPLTLGMAALVLTVCLAGPINPWPGRPRWLGASAGAAVLATWATLLAPGGNLALAASLAGALSARAAWQSALPGPERLRRGHVMHALQQLQRRAAAKALHALLMLLCAGLMALR